MGAILVWGNGCIVGDRWRQPSLVAVLLTGLLAIQMPRSTCPSLLPITVTSSEENGPLLAELAASFNAGLPMVGNQCVQVSVVRKASGATEHTATT